MACSNNQTELCGGKKSAFPLPKQRLNQSQVQADLTYTDMATVLFPRRLQHLEMVGATIPPNQQVSLPQRQLGTLATFLAIPRRLQVEHSAALPWLTTVLPFKPVPVIALSTGISELSMDANATAGTHWLLEVCQLQTVGATCLAQGILVCSAAGPAA